MKAFIIFLKIIKCIANKSIKKRFCFIAGAKFKHYRLKKRTQMHRYFNALVETSRICLFDVEDHLYSKKYINYTNEKKGKYSKHFD